MKDIVITSQMYDACRGAGSPAEVALLWAWARGMESVDCATLEAELCLSPYKSQKAIEYLATRRVLSADYAGRGNYALRWYDHGAEPDGPAEPATEPAEHPRRRKVYSRSYSVAVKERHAEGFARFWAGYPRKIGKALAFKRFMAKTAGNGEEMEKLAKAAEEFAKKCAAEGREMRYIPHASTWLSQERWEDEPEETTPDPEDKDYSW